MHFKIEEFTSSVPSLFLAALNLHTCRADYSHASSYLTDQIDPMCQTAGVLRSSLPANGVTATAMEVWDGSSGAALSLEKSSTDPTGPPNRTEKPWFP